MSMMDIHMIVDRLREYKFEEDLTLVTFGIARLCSYPPMLSQQ